MYPAKRAPHRRALSRREMNKIFNKKNYCVSFGRIHERQSFLLPTLSSLSVRVAPANCLRFWCSRPYQRISPLLGRFRLPLTPSKFSSIQNSSKVKPMRFNLELTKPPTDSLRPINPGNARGLCITATAGTELVTPYSPSTVCPCGLPPK